MSSNTNMTSRVGFTCNWYHYYINSFHDLMYIYIILLYFIIHLHNFCCTSRDITKLRKCILYDEKKIEQLFEPYLKLSIPAPIRTNVALI